ncbi:MAG: hypothetical protein IPN29_16235 [Saprospiraceae bacterium]|nr:hypothetical protein [Saprospiraceae bacterium]
MKKNLLTLLGFGMFVLGALSLILSLVGLKLDMLGFLYKAGGGFALLIHLVMIFGGIALMFVARAETETDTEMDKDLVE